MATWLKRGVTAEARADLDRKVRALLPQVVAAYHELAADADLVLVEGAGSASEVNLRATDIANFGFARAVNSSVLLAGDIDRGGVIASVVRTFAVIAPDDAALIRAHFPYLSEYVVAVLHARRCGWMSAQQLGMYLLERAHERGLVHDRTARGIDEQG